MITQRDRVVVGLFVLATAGILITFLAILWGVRASQRYKRYYVSTETSVAGLTPSSSVKYLGVDAGRVEKMEFDSSIPPKVRITLAVFENAPIMSDTMAQLTPQGITGIQFIELIRGKSDKELAPESEIKFIQSKFTDIVAKVDDLSGAINIFFGENKNKISTTIDNANTFLETSTKSVASLSSRIEVMLDENRVALRELIARARVAVDDTSRIVADVHDKRLVDDASATIADARKAIQELEATVKDVRGQLGPNRIGDAIADVRSTAQSANTLLTRASGRVEDDLAETGRLIEELRRTVASVKQLAREVSTRPSLLVRDLEQDRREVRDK
ncbi:MAG: MlaD family protein [Planctomycetota bacterium]